MLEESAWSTQAKIQTIAQTRLDMIMPSPSKIEMVSLGHAAGSKNQTSHVLAENNVGSFGD